MSKTLTTVRGQVRSYLDEQTASDWTNAELNTLINTFYHKVRTAVASVFEDYYMTTTTFDSVASQHEYGSTDGAPTDVFKIRRVELNYDVSNTSCAPTRCLPINLDEVRRDLALTNSGIGLRTYSQGKYYTYGFGSSFKIGFIPIPDKAGTDAIKLWYVKEAADLSSDSSTFDLPYVDNYWILIAWGAAAEALRFGQQESAEADKLDLKFNKGLSQMQEELEDKITEESKKILDISGETFDF